MSCERFTTAITDHACGAPIDARAAAHLASCPACLQALVDQRTLLADAEADLRRALNLTASSDFRARVLARLQEKQPVAWYARWKVAAAAVVILTVAAGTYVTWTSPQRQESLPALATAPSVSAGNAVTPAVPAPSILTDGDAPRDRTRRRANARTRRATAGATRTNAELPVIVPDSQSRAIARLVELLRSGQLDATNLPPPRESVSRPAQLTIPPLTVPDIVIPDVENVTGGLIDTDVKPGTGKGV